MRATKTSEKQGDCDMSKTGSKLVQAGLAAGFMLLAACGETTTQQAATGALGGAVVAGPPGAAVGGAIGAMQ